MNSKKFNSKIPIQLMSKQNRIPRFSFDNVNNLITNNFINKKEIIKPKKVRKVNKNKIITENNANTFSSNKSNKVLNSQLNSQYKNAENKITNDNEINLLGYEEARHKDKRTYCQYYCSLLKNEHLILFTFIQNNDYNLLSLKFSLFILTVSLEIAINALFFSDLLYITISILY